jgi:AcrR family transcriptional regulator
MKEADGVQFPDEGTQARILTTAAEMLAEEGYAALSMRKIGARLGLSQAAIYRHYESKGALVARIIEAGYRRMLGRVQAAAEGEADPREVLRKCFKAYLAFAIENPQLFRSILLGPLGAEGSAIAALSPGVTRKRESFALLAGTLRRGMELGLFASADIESTAQAVWAAMFGLSARLAIEGRGLDETAARVAEREIDIILRGLSV